MRIRRDLRLESANVRAEHEALLVTDLRDRLLDFRAQRRVLTLEVE
jgi:hypothetical protein